MQKIFLSTSLFFFYIIFGSIFPVKVFANFVKQNNIALPISTTRSWDNLQVYGPAILYEKELYKIWYSGNDGNKRQIGYADSPNPYNFNKSVNNPIIPWNTIHSDDIGVEHPTILKQDSYKMWFNTVEANFQNFHLYYSSSTDGFTWNKFSPLSFDLSSSTWDSLGMGAPMVIFNSQQNLYHLWYVAKGNYNGSTRWRIGYATSTDGLSWTKHPAPVLESIGGWEGSDVGNPSVLFENGTYHMWYHGDFGIGHATSPNGTDWTRDPENPVLVPTIGTFDSQRVFNPYVLKINDVYYMWYTGIDNNGRWQIGLATSEPISIPLPTSTPTITPAPTATPSFTPTPTVSPTPTVTPTLSPMLTPTPTTSQPFAPIVIIPGLGASWNPKDIFSCSINSGGKWELAPYVSVYNRLIKTLTENGGLTLNRDVYLYAYDWRKPLSSQADSFKNFLDNIRINRPGDIKFRLIGHSLGGLIARSYLISYPTDHHIISLLTVGTPHFGTVAAYPIWEKGEIQSDDLLLSIAVNQVISHCRIVRTFIPPLRKSIFQYRFKTGREVVQYLVPVIKQLLPTFDYLRANGQVKAVSTLKHQNDWIPKYPVPSDHYNVSLHTLSGKNTPTLRFLDVINPSIRESIFGDWLDGKPIGNQKSDSGDGTVLNLSSQIEPANNQIIAGSHTEIISSDTGISKILNFLGIPDIPIAPAVVSPEETSVNALTVSLSQEAKITITDPRGTLRQARNNIFVSYNPSAGLYRLEITAKETEEALLHISRIEKEKLPEGKSFAVKLTKSKPSRFYLVYNPESITPIQLISL